MKNASTRKHKAMICCLNPVCNNPSAPNGKNFCSECGVRLVILRNRYRPIKSLGSGGFGKTYLAEDVDKLNEKCVIKQFAPQAQSTYQLRKATDLFEEEAKRLQQLGEYPQIPTLLAYFEENSQLYLVQQYINGQNLFEELQQKGTFNEKKIRNLLEDLLNILKFVHQHNVIHRDVKPENIIQREDGKVVLIDFGVSKQLTNTVITQRGSMIGSWGYAPLEQMQGGEAYRASDLYSLGATCFHLLTGIHPWELWRNQGYSWVDNWQQHLQQNVSHELKKIIDKLLQVEYQQRYQSVEEVLKDLNQPSQPKAEERAEYYYNEGIEKYNANDFQGAIEDFSQAIFLNPKYSCAYNDRGDARYELGDYQAALEDYTKSIEINPNDELIYYNRGLANYDLGNKQAAIEDYTRAIQINPKYESAYFKRSIARGDLEDNLAAIEDYTQLIQINPNDGSYYYIRGLTRSILKHHLSAIEDYRKAADLFKKQGKYDDYKKALKEIHHKKKSIFITFIYWAAMLVCIGVVLNGIGNLYLSHYVGKGFEKYDNKDFSGAIEDCKHVIEINPKYRSAHSCLGMSYSGLEKHQLAIKHYTKAIEIRSQNILAFADLLLAEYYYNRGITYYDLEDKKAAIEDFDKAIEINPNYAGAYNNRGAARSDLGDNKGAIEDFNKAIEADSNHVLAYYNLGNVRSDLGDDKGAIKDYNKALEINPDYTSAYLMRGNVYYDLGDKKAAIKDYDKAIEINPNYALAYSNRGNARSGLGDEKGAIEDYDRAIQINPDYADAYFNRGNTRSDLGDEKGAIEDYDRAIEINPNYAAAYNNQGVSHMVLGNNKAAIEDYNKSIEIDPDYAGAYFNRGLVRNSLGDKQAAIKDFRKAANLYKQQGKDSKYQESLNRIKSIQQLEELDKSLENLRRLRNQGSQP